MTVNYPAGTTLTGEAKTALDGNFDCLKKREFPKIEIIGYSDASGSDAANLTISEKRAKAAKDYLVKKGVPADKIKDEGKGKADLLAGVDENSPKHRRAEFKFAQ